MKIRKKIIQSSDRILRSARGKQKKRGPYSPRFDSGGVLSSEREYICDRCGHSSKRKSNLETHWLSHLGKKDFKCSTCHMAFARSQNLKRHELVCGTGPEKAKVKVESVDDNPPNKWVFDITKLPEYEAYTDLNWWKGQDETSKLIPLKTIADGNCLCHAVCQLLTGVQDTNLHLRKGNIHDFCLSFHGVFLSARVFIGLMKFNEFTELFLSTDTHFF